MDLAYYRQREQAARQAAEQARDAATRTTQLELAQSYRGVIETYERLERLRPPSEAA